MGSGADCNRIQLQQWFLHHGPLLWSIQGQIIAVVQKRASLVTQTIQLGNLSPSRVGTLCCARVHVSTLGEIIYIKF